jgi:hypothetical protein
VTGLHEPLLPAYALIGDSSVSEGGRRVPGAQRGAEGYGQPDNSTTDDGGFISRVLDTPVLADSAAVSPLSTYHNLEELPMSVIARGASAHPNTPDTPSHRSAAAMTA